MALFIAFFRLTRASVLLAVSSVAKFEFVLIIIYLANVVF